MLSRRLVSTYHADDIMYLPFDPPLVSTIGFVWLPDEQPSKIAQDFMDFVYSDFNHKLKEEER